VSDKFLSFGEIMLRLRTNGYERFFQSPSFEATFGGGEANVAVKPKSETLIGRLFSRAQNGCTSQALPLPCHKTPLTYHWNA